MSDSLTPGVLQDMDDICSCDSIYHSFTNTLVRESPLDVADPEPDAAAPPTESDASGVPEPDVGSIKDQRSHERARQRLKKPEDMRRAKRCVRCKKCKPEKWAGNAGHPKQDDRILRVSLKEAEDEHQVDPHDNVEIEEHPGATVAGPSVVSLADLITPPRRGSDKQFEIVRRPRQVLAMDDFTEAGPKSDFDEWEYVETEAKRKADVPASPTYASVVARA